MSFKKISNFQTPASSSVQADQTQSVSVTESTTEKIVGRTLTSSCNPTIAVAQKALSAWTISPLTSGSIETIGSHLQETPSVKSPFPPIHYTWIGPPGGSGIRGHDIASPRLMAMKNKDNPIIFWCLKDFQNHYEKQFAGTRVQVRSVDECLERLAPSRLEGELSELDEQTCTPEQAALELRKLRNRFSGNLTSLNNESKYCGRDKIVFKDLFTLFLLMTQGGYTLDTNVLPIAGRQIVSLPQQNNQDLMISHIKKGAKRPGKDVFLMYSSMNEETKINDTAKRALCQQYHYDLELEQHRRNENTYIKFHGTTLLYTLSECNSGAFQGAYHVAQESQEMPAQQVAFEDLGIEKIYYNTHYEMQVMSAISCAQKDFESMQNELIHPSPRSVRRYHPLHMAASQGNVAHLTILLSEGEDVNTRSLYDDEVGATPLHHAVKHGKTEAVKFLLDHGADPTLEVLCDDGSKKTALELAGNNSSIMKLLSSNIKPRQNITFPSFPLHRKIANVFKKLIKKK